MKLALNGATIMGSPLNDDVEIAAEAGYAALEIWAGKLPAYEQTRSLEELAHKMRALGIAPSCINSIEGITHQDAAGRRALMSELHRLCAVARTLGAPAIVVVPGFQPEGYSRHESVDDAVDVLRAMSDDSGDVSLAFEFLGKPGCAVSTLDMAIEIVERAHRPNVGLIIDTFHFYAGGSRMDDLARVRVEQILAVHLNGCDDLPRDQLTDAHRRYPGDGAIPSTEILRKLAAMGYDGTVSIELFRPEYWEHDARAVARSARDRALGVLAAAGCGVTSVP